MISKIKECYRKIKESYLSIKKIYRNVFYSILIAILTLFVGLIISFIITKVMPGDPVRLLLPRNATREQYLALKHELGFDQPLIIQFFRYIGDLFTGNWGVSISSAPGKEVWELFKERLPRTVEILIMPVIVGLAVGILLGKLAIKYKDKWADKVIRISAILGISVPVFWLGLIFQYVFTIQLDWLPAFGFKSGDWKYYIMPVSVLTIALSSLITLQTRSTLESETVERSIISNVLIIGESFGFIIMFYILTELTFSINGVGIMLIDAIRENDIFSLSGILFSLILTLVIVTFIANIIFSLYRYITVESRNEQPVLYNKVNEQEVERTDIGFKVRLKNYLFQWLKSPFLIIGTVLVAFAILVALFPQILTPYTLAETLDFYPNAEYPDQFPWMEPSKDHPLGTTKFGRDLLAVISWATRDTLIVGIGAALIGLIGGAIFGFIAGRSKLGIKRAIMGLMIIAFIIPAFILVLLIMVIFGLRYDLIIYTIGILLIPSFTRVIADATSQEIDFKKISKAAISYIPLNVALSILIYVSLGFFGYPYPAKLPQLSFYIIEARIQLYNGNLWFVFWPGLVIFIIVLGFFFLHEGLKDQIR